MLQPINQCSYSRLTYLTRTVYVAANQTLHIRKVPHLRQRVHLQSISQATPSTSWQLYFKEKVYIIAQQLLHTLQAAIIKTESLYCYHSTTACSTGCQILIRDIMLSPNNCCTHCSMPYCIGNVCGNQSITSHIENCLFLGQNAHRESFVITN